MLAGNCMRNCWTATSYTEYHRNGCIHAACSPGCRPLGSHSQLATIPSTTPRSPPPAQNSPHWQPRQAQPAQNSPYTHKNADFGPLSARRENLFTLTPITSHAGRTLYRTRGRCRYKTLPAHRPGGITRYKTLPARGPVGPTRYKTLPARPKYPFSAHFEPAGRVLYRFHHHQAEQGEKSHAPTPHLTPVTCPPPIPHATPKHK